jgi:CheY-like chemotaxis protein
MIQELQKQITHPQVMLVDDSSIDNFVNKKVIARYQFAEEVLEFTKVRLALRYLLQLNDDTEIAIPVILFLDLDMPEINGFEFLDAFELLSDRIRENLSIVILTSSINPADIENCNRHRSVLTFMHKPLMKNNLDMINALVSKKNAKLVMCQVA